jgi:hypothetical protein
MNVNITDFTKTSICIKSLATSTKIKIRFLYRLKYPLCFNALFYL